MTARLAVLGAFPFPAPQGSQLYARDQARALHAAGAEVRLLCYGHGVGASDEPFEVARTPALLSPRRVRAGMSVAKPVADAALVALLAWTTRRRRLDAVLAHNAEAAVVALAARAVSPVPVVYVAHTLWRYELPSYGPRAGAEALARAGEALDLAVARRVDATIALSELAARELRPAARGPLALIPPGLDPAPAPAAEEVEAACKRRGLEPGRYVLYAGNLDRYQGLDDLDAAARALPDVPFVAATHDPRRRVLDAVRVVALDSAGEGRALTFAAGVCVLPRAIHGGFPVKLLNYMEAARPIVARRNVAEGFSHERDALLLAPDARPDALAAAVRRLFADPHLAARLGDGARALLDRRHAWPALARQTLALVSAARSVRARPAPPAAG